MSSLYNMLRETAGLTQTEAVGFHDARLDTIKSWCSDRRPAPAGALEEMRALAGQVVTAGNDYARMLLDGSSGVFVIGTPRDDDDARSCGFPTASAQMRAVAIAMAQLPAGAEIRMVERVRGAIPSAVVHGPAAATR